VKSVYWELRNGSSTPSSNCDVCAKASAVFVLPVPVRFAFASLSFLHCSFASTITISRACCDSNFLIYFLLRAEDHVEVGAVEVGVVVRTWIKELVSAEWEEGIISSSLSPSISVAWVIGGSESSSLNEVVRSIASFSLLWASASRSARRRARRASFSAYSAASVSIYPRLRFGLKRTFGWGSGSGISASIAVRLAMNSSVLECSFVVRSIKPEAKVSLCPIGNDWSFATASAAALMINYAPLFWYHNPDEDETRCFAPRFLINRSSTGYFFSDS